MKNNWEIYTNKLPKDGFNESSQSALDAIEGSNSIPENERLHHLNNLNNRINNQVKAITFKQTIKKVSIAAVLLITLVGATYYSLRTTKNELVTKNTGTKHKFNTVQQPTIKKEKYSTTTSLSKEEYAKKEYTPQILPVSEKIYRSYTPVVYTVEHLLPVKTSIKLLEYNKSTTPDTILWSQMEYDEIYLEKVNQYLSSTQMNKISEQLISHLDSEFWNTHEKWIIQHKKVTRIKRPAHAVRHKKAYRPKSIYSTGKGEPGTLKKPKVNAKRNKPKYLLVDIKNEIQEKKFSTIFHKIETLPEDIHHQEVFVMYQAICALKLNKKEEALILLHQLKGTQFNGIAVKQISILSIK